MPSFPDHYLFFKTFSLIKHVCSCAVTQLVECLPGKDQRRHCPQTSSHALQISCSLLSSVGTGVVSWSWLQDCTEMWPRNESSRDILDVIGGHFCSLDASALDPRHGPWHSWSWGLSYLAHSGFLNGRKFRREKEPGEVTPVFQWDWKSCCKAWNFDFLFGLALVPLHFWPWHILFLPLSGCFLICKMRGLY